MSKTYGVLVADPPWRFGDRLPGKSRGAGKNYRTMSHDQVCALVVPTIVRPDAYLFLWRVSAMVEEAYEVGRAWGFVPKTEIVWQKLTKNWKPWVGMGHHVRASHETAIVFTRGKPERLSASELSTFVARVPVDADGKYVHSAKPDEFFAKVERLAGPGVELFARRTRPGWVCLGDGL
jgi:N6-adenosine-specific RNA methylase IME4